MKRLEAPLSPTPYVGQVRNGVVAFDAHVPIADGQIVRVEPLPCRNDVRADSDRADRVRQLQKSFGDWNEEESQLTDEEADRLDTALAQHARLTLWSAKLDWREERDDLRGAPECRTTPSASQTPSRSPGSGAQEVRRVG